MIASLYSQIPGSAAATGEYDGYYTYRTYLRLTNGTALTLYDIHRSLACSTEVSISLGFGSSSNTWSIDPSVFKLAQLSQDSCLGAFFELSSSGSSTPEWIVGDTFLVSHVVRHYRPSSNAKMIFLEKCLFGIPCLEPTCGRLCQPFLYCPCDEWG